ncbi:DUF4367 domain-containing protein [Paradesulfitobacterium aromaticivorans]
MAYSELEFEKKIKEQIAKELANTIEVPPFEEQWAKVKAELLKETTPVKPELKRFKLRKLAWIAVALMVIGSFSMISPGVANGFGSKIVEFFNYAVGKTTRNQAVTYKNPNEPSVPPDVNSVDVPQAKEVSLAEAQALISTNLAVPGYLPPGMKFRRALLTNLSNGFYNLTIEYELNGNVIVFEQQRIAKATSLGTLYDTDDTVVKDLIINGNPAVLFSNKNGMNTINWQLGGLLLHITGKVDQVELQKMAQSIT